MKINSSKQAHDPYYPLLSSKEIAKSKFLELYYVISKWVFFFLIPQNNLSKIGPTCSMCLTIYGWILG